MLRLAVDGNLQDIPVAELAELFDWMVPPSRKHELEIYRNNLRRQAVRDADLESPTVREEKKNILRRHAIRAALEEKERLKFRKSPQPTVRTGPRGGRYRINSNGKKVYNVP